MTELTPAASADVTTAPIATMRVALFVAAADLAAADAALNQVYDTPGESNFSIELSANGEAPATHFGAYTTADEASWAALRDPMIAAVPSAAYYCVGLDREGSLLSGRLIETSSPTAVGQRGDTWSWARSLQDAGITPVVVPDPLGL